MIDNNRVDRRDYFNVINIKHLYTLTQLLYVGPEAGQVNDFFC